MLKKKPAAVMAAISAGAPSATSVTSVNSVMARARASPPGCAGCAPDQQAAGQHAARRHEQEAVNAASAVATGVPNSAPKATTE